MIVELKDNDGETTQTVDLSKEMPYRIVNALIAKPYPEPPIFDGYRIQWLNPDGGMDWKHVESQTDIDLPDDGRTPIAVKEIYHNAFYANREHTLTRT